jgi:pimeloyl-ACP methyl ester carboxylesterase
MINKRHMIALSLGALGALSVKHAFADKILPPVILSPLQPPSALVGKTTRYATMATPGPYGEPVSAFRLNLANNLIVNLWLPPQQKSGRLVVFSHGELASPEIYARILNHWVSHGYAIVAPLHDDSIIEQGIQNTHDAFLNNNDLLGINKLLKDTQSWKKRSDDCRAVLDAISFIENSSGFQFIKERPIMIGHSLGAFTSQLLMGVRALATDKTTIIENNDPRFYATILMSPQGRGTLGLVDGSWDNVTRPMMVITGGGDNDASMQTPDVKAEPYWLSQPNNKHLVWNQKINTLIYNGQQIRANTPEEMIFSDLKSVTTTFLQAYSAYDESAFKDITGNYFDQASDGRMALQYR